MTPLAPRTRTGILLLALSAAVAAGLLLWDDSEIPTHRIGSNIPGTRQPSDTPAAGVPTATTPSEEPDVPRSTRISDAEFAEQSKEFGIIVSREYSPTDTGSFFFVQLDDSSRSLRGLGFIRAASLLDSTAAFDGLGDALPSHRLRVASVQFTDSILREREDGCVLPRPIPMRRSGASENRWSLALMAGAAQAVPANAWRVRRDSVADHAEALRLMSKQPMHPVYAKFLAREDSLREAEERANAYRYSRYGDARDSIARDSVKRADSARIGQHDSLMATARYEMKMLHRFTLDGIEYMIVNATREWETDSGGAARLAGLQVLTEQFAFIAERDPRDRASPFQIVWHHQDIGDPDQNTTQEPMFLLRLGPERLLTLLTDWDFGDGGGGIFYSRVGRGHWKRIARWTDGC